MKRYLLFGGDDYYPAGGWGDFLGDFDSVPDAVAAAASHPMKPQWAEVVDTETMATVTEATRPCVRGYVRMDTLQWSPPLVP